MKTMNWCLVLLVATVAMGCDLGVHTVTVTPAPDAGGSDVVSNDVSGPSGYDVPGSDAQGDVVGQDASVDAGSDVDAGMDSADVDIDATVKQCATVADCDDGNVCTNDNCYMRCWHSPVCDDGSSCTIDSCDEASGTCQFKALADFSDCNDGDLCTTTDYCAKGKCVGVGSKCDDDNACTADSCNMVAKGGWVCANTAIPGCNECSQAADCDDGNACTDDFCNSAACDHMWQPFCCNVDTDCVLSAGQCPSGTCTNNLCDFTPKAQNCDDKNPCTKDSCANGDCVHEDLGPNCGLAKEGEACSTDGQCYQQPGFTWGACHNGKCTEWYFGPGSKSCSTDTQCDDGNPCTENLCLQKAGKCTSYNVLDGLKCDDGNTCSGLDSCLGGQCVSAPFPTQLTITMNATSPVLQTVPAGSLDVTLGVVELTTGTGSSGSSITKKIVVKHTGIAPLQDVVILKFWDGDVLVAQSFGYQGEYDLFMSITVPAGTKKTLTLKANFAANAVTAVHAFAITSVVADSDCGLVSANGLPISLNPVNIIGSTPTCTTAAQCDDGNIVTTDICDSVVGCKHTKKPWWLQLDFKVSNDASFLSNVGIEFQQAGLAGATVVDLTTQEVAPVNGTIKMSVDPLIVDFCNGYATGLPVTFRGLYYKVEAGKLTNVQVQSNLITATIVVDGVSYPLPLVPITAEQAAKVSWVTGGHYTAPDLAKFCQVK